VPSLPLPWGRSIDHHKSIRYAETEERLTVPFAVSREAEGGLVKFVASGNCPACGGWMTKELSYGIPGTKGFRRGPTPGDPGTATLICECGHVHPGKPAGAADDGCGRYWPIDLTTP
jgi:hypothetical protein